MIEEDVLRILNERRIPVHIGVDFNVEHMAGICAIIVDGIICVFKEYIDYFDTPDLIAAIKADFYKCKVISYPDASGGNRSTINASTSDIALLRKARFSVRAKTKRNPFVRDRIASVNNAFNRKKLQIDVDRCPEITESLEQQIYMPNGSPDKTNNIDHPIDALGYLVHYIMPVRDARIIATATAQ